MNFVKISEKFEINYLNSTWNCQRAKARRFQIHDLCSGGMKTFLPTQHPTYKGKKKILRKTTFPQMTFNLDGESVIPVLTTFLFLDSE